MEELQFQVQIDPNLEGPLTGVVAFGEFEVQEGAVYPLDGIRAFYEDLIMGRPFPLVFAAREIVSLSQIVGITLFLFRDLAIHPDTPKFITAVDLVDRYQHAGAAHVEPELLDFFKFLLACFPSDLTKDEQGARLKMVVGRVRQYLHEGSLPSMISHTKVPRVLDVGTNGFVVAEVPKGRDLEAAWVELFRRGYLRGALFGTGGEQTEVLVAKKSPFVLLDLERAATILNDAEFSMGAPGSWVVKDLWLRSPEGGTLLPPKSVLDVLVRV